MLLNTQGLSALALVPVLFKPMPGMTTTGVGNFSASTSGRGTTLSELPITAVSNNLHAPASPQLPSLLEVSNPAQIMDQQHESLCNVNSYNPPPVEESFPSFDRDKATVYRYRQQQSVNLGSWFVQEQWMTPSLFKCASGKQVSELDVASGWGSIESARAVLERHWDTFVNQSDFEYLASIGVNTVRLPIGYWSLGPYYCQDTVFSAVANVYQNSWSRIVRAINMAGEMGIGVLVDLHGAVGSQNGQPHSGISDGSANLFTVPSNMDKTIAALQFLMQRLCNVTNVVGIQILNEPQDVPELLDFYTRAISSMRQVSPDPTFPLYLHDGFNLPRVSKYIANRTDFVVQDHHSYFVFTPSDETEPASQHTNDIETTVADSLSTASEKQHRNLVVDEWSCALTPKSILNEADQPLARKNFCTKQMEVYSKTTAGWSFWSYKTEAREGNVDWCFKTAVGTSLPSTFFSYPGTSQSLATAIADPSAMDILLKAQQINSTSSPTSLSPRLRSWLISEAPLPPPSESVASKSRSRRFASIHHHRQDNRDENDLIDMSEPSAQATLNGYSNGFLAAKTFAMSKMSKLGFTEQYIQDSPGSIAMAAGGTKKYYREGFLMGMRDGEKAVVSMIM